MIVWDVLMHLPAETAFTACCLLPQMAHDRPVSDSVNAKAKETVLITELWSTRVQSR